MRNLQESQALLQVNCSSSLSLYLSGLYLLYYSPKGCCVVTQKLNVYFIEKEGIVKKKRE
jgi:hypothetical protein